jgi:hypothetical protein
MWCHEPTRVRGSAMLDHKELQTLHRVFQKELYNGILNVTLWQVLRKRLHLRACKLSIVQGVERCLYAFKCKCFRNSCHKVTFRIPSYRYFWNTLHYQLRSQWIVTIPGKTRYVLLHYDSSNHRTCPLNTFIQALKVVKLFLEHPVLLNTAQVKSCKQKVISMS